MPRPGGNPNRPALPNGPGHGRTKGAKNKITAARVEQEIALVALSDPLELFERIKKGGHNFRLLDIDEMPPSIRRCIASVKVRTENLTPGDDKQDQTIEIKLWDKTKALEMLGRYFGMFKDKLELVAPEELLGRLDRAKQRSLAAKKGQP